MNWAPLHQHTHFSLLDGLNKPDKLAQRIKLLGYTSAAITDHGNIGACVKWIDACEKEGIKPIIGNEFYLCQKHPELKEKENRPLAHLCVLAKNQKGWKDLIAATTASNRDLHFYYRPRLSLDVLGTYIHGNCIAFSGHPGSELANVLFSQCSYAYRSKTREDVLQWMNPNAKNDAIKLASKYRDIFGSHNFFIEIQLIDSDKFPAACIIAEILREVSVSLNIPCVATADSHYGTRKQAEDQRILLCSNLHCTLKEVESKIQTDDDFGMKQFFISDSYHVPKMEELLAQGNNGAELQTAADIADMCEKYKIKKDVSLPKFDCPNGMSSAEYLRHLCREGWKKKFDSAQVDKQLYGDRVKYELSVLSEAKLEDYFLIVKDIIDWYKNQGGLVSTGRGSVAGCLVAYLLGITRIDSIKYGLMFERFYNKGRNTATKVSLPDIDSDFEVEKRDVVVEYIRQKYGAAKVAQIATFGRLQGRSALKEVMRVKDALPFDEINRITAHIPDEAAIIDELQEVREAGEEPSIIKWALENNAEQLSEWCVLEDNGTLSGDFANDFAQAIRLEGTLKSQGRHAAGLVLSQDDLESCVPMLHDKNSENLIAGLEYGDLEATGNLKIDVLGVAVLDKIASAMK